jgi:hypothetical protein
LRKISASAVERTSNGSNMELARVPSALHVRTGDPGAAELIDAWCRTHGVDAHVCGDAYDACVHLLKRADHVPDVVFIGVDWLAPDEHEIICYARETWPAVGLVLYGGAPANPAATPPALVCASRGELSALLSEAPAALAARFEQLTELPTPRRDSAAAPLDPAENGLGPSRPGAKAAEADALRGVLTREELSALLDDDDR